MSLLSLESIFLLLVRLGRVVDVSFFVFFEKVHVACKTSDGLSVTVFSSVVGGRKPFERGTRCKEREER